MPMQLHVPRPLWFAVPAVVLVLVVVGLGFGVPAYQQWTAVNEMSEFGCIDIGGRSPVGPNWLRRLIGEERMLAFDDVQSFHFNPDINRHLRLYFVWTGATGQVIDDAGLASIIRFTRLKRLRLSCTNITDVALQHVSQLKKLEALFLDGTDVTDASIPLLKRLPNLRELSLRGTRVSEAGVEELKRAIPGLKVTR